MGSGNIFPKILQFGVFPCAARHTYKGPTFA